MRFTQFIAEQLPQSGHAVRQWVFRHPDAASNIASASSLLLVVAFVAGLILA